jgi:hypothetical protein
VHLTPGCELFQAGSLLAAGQLECDECGSVRVGAGFMMGE